MLSNKSIAIGLISFGSVALLISALVVYELNRTLPENVFLADASLTGLNREQALDQAVELMRVWENLPVEITVDTLNNRRFTLKELGIRYQPDKTVTSVFNHTSPFLSWLVNASSTPLFDFNEQTFSMVLETYLYSHEKDFQNAKIIWNEKQWMIEEATSGLLLQDGEVEKIKKILLETARHAEKNSFPLSIPVQYETVPPQRFAVDVQPLFDRIQELIRESIAMKIDREQVQVSLFDDPQWLVIDESSSSVILHEAFAREKIHEFALDWNNDPGKVIITGIQELISEYDKKPYKKAIFEGDFHKGRRIDEEKILIAFRQMFKDPQASRTIAVDWQTLEPQMYSLVPNYQFPQILSTGISSFRLGNYPARVKNIKLSLGSFQGVIIDSGEEFSFNRITGWITPRKGYTKTKIINEGKVEEGIGGGVCQTSTTVYRSILNAGFPLTERRNHTLDVAYYHQFGYGLDATVYTDSRNDLRFINNFPSPIIVNAFTDDPNALAYVEFYGTTDQRAVELTNIPTGDWLLKKWQWKISWPATAGGPDREEVRMIQSRYQIPKEDTPKNPLEG